MKGAQTIAHDKLTEQLIDLNILNQHSQLVWLLLVARDILDCIVLDTNEDAANFADIERIEEIADYNEVLSLCRGDLEEITGRIKDQKEVRNL